MKGTVRESRAAGSPDRALFDDGDRFGNHHGFSPVKRVRADGSQFFSVFDIAVRRRDEIQFGEIFRINASAVAAEGNLRAVCDLDRRQVHAAHEHGRRIVVLKTGHVCAD